MPDRIQREELICLVAQRSGQDAATAKVLAALLDEIYQLRPKEAMVSARKLYNREQSAPNTGLWNKT